MTTLNQLRKAALARPEVEQGTRSGTVTFRVRGRGFASVTGDGQVRLPLPAAETEAALAAARAPRGLAAALAAAEGAADRPRELPAGIGKPATRALFGAGVSTFEQVATHTEDELLALHGVGPKAVRILAAALAERGMSLRSP